MGYEYGYRLPPNKLEGETDWSETVLGTCSESEYAGTKVHIDTQNKMKGIKADWFIREVKD